MKNLKNIQMSSYQSLWLTSERPSISIDTLYFADNHRKTSFFEF